MPNKPEKRSMAMPIIVLVLIATALSFFSLGAWVFSGKKAQTTEETAPVEKTSYRMKRGFNSIDVSLVNAVIIVSPEASDIVKVSSASNIDEDLSMEVKGSTLYIKSGNKAARWNNESVTIEVGIDKLDDINISGACEVKSDGQLNGKNVSVTSSGAGDIDLDISAESVKVSSSGASDIDMNISSESMRVSSSGASNITFTGSVSEMLRIDSSGSSKFDCSELNVNECRINASGLSEITVRVEESLDVKASGTAVVNYYGSPSVSKSLSGFVELNNIN